MTHSSAIVGQPAGLLPRLGAAVYDGFLLIALFFLATAVVDPFMSKDHVPAGNPWFRTYLLLVMFLFYGWFWTHGGQTLGMRAWRLRAVGPNDDKITWSRAALRFVFAWLAWVSVIGLLWCAIDGRALHDRWSGTRVLRLSKT